MCNVQRDSLHGSLVENLRSTVVEVENHNLNNLRIKHGLRKNRLLISGVVPDVSIRNHNELCSCLSLFSRPFSSHVGFGVVAFSSRRRLTRMAKLSPSFIASVYQHHPTYWPSRDAHGAAMYECVKNVGLSDFHPKNVIRNSQKTIFDDDFAAFRELIFHSPQAHVAVENDQLRDSSHSFCRLLCPWSQIRCLLELRCSLVAAGLMQI